MLRRLMIGHAAAQPPGFFDITNCKNSRFVQAASGQMMVANRAPARDPVEMSLGGRTRADWEDEIGGLSEQMNNRSQTADLHPAVEEVMKEGTPLSKGSGPIEASKFHHLRH